MPDGQVLHVQGELLILAVGNGRQAGGGMRLCPYAGQRTQPTTSPHDAHSAQTMSMTCVQAAAALYGVSRHASLYHSAWGIATL